MSMSLRRSAGVVAVATVAALVIWAAVRLLGVELTLKDGEAVGPAAVAVTAVLAGLAAWGVHRLLDRTARTARWWPSVGSIALALSILGPSYLADGAAAVALISLHVMVGFILIMGFARFVPHRSYWTRSSAA